MLLILLALILVVSALIYLIHRMHSEHKQQEELVDRLRTSRIYEGVYPMLQRCKGLTIDEVLVRPEALSITLLGYGHETYVFDEHGIDPLRPDTLLALSQAIALDFPVLQDTLYYLYEPHTERLPSGEKQTYYTYTLKHDRKDYLLRHHQMNDRDR